MMGIPPSDAKRLSICEYQGLLYRWNERHTSEDDLPPPDPDEVDDMFANMPQGAFH